VSVVVFTITKITVTRKEETIDVRNKNLTSAVEVELLSNNPDFSVFRECRNKAKHQSPFNEVMFLLTYTYYFIHK
jgi:hypothetical protein